MANFIIDTIDKVKETINPNFSELIASESDINYCSDHANRRIIHNNFVHSVKEFVINDAAAANFNDLIYSTHNDFNYCYDESAFSLTNDTENCNFRVHAGAPYRCLYCGFINSMSNYYICPTCEKQVRLFYNINNAQGRKEIWL